jgi:CRP-like cAMP-binding protein
MEAQLNAVLGRLDPRREKELFAALMPIEFNAAQALQDAGSIPNYCYFPVSGLVSLVAKDEHDQTIESASIGSTGAINLSAVSYNAASLVSAVAQLPVRAFRAPTTIVRRAARESVAVQQAVFLAQRTYSNTRS